MHTRCKTHEIRRQNCTHSLQKNVSGQYYYKVEYLYKLKVTITEQNPLAQEFSHNTACLITPAYTLHSYHSSYTFLCCVYEHSMGIFTENVESAHMPTKVFSCMHRVLFPERGVSVITRREKKMAEGPDPREKALEELEKEITCAVCHGFYQQAKLLPCNHYYCSTCIEKMAVRSGGGPFDCPECRKETSLPAGGVAGLQPAFFVERIKDLHGKMARAEGKVEALCEQCAGEKSVAFCRQCAEFICGDCVAIHKKIKAFAGHVVASLEDLKKGGVKNIPLKEATARKCEEHDKTLKLFCFDCERLICRDCTIIEHKEHKFEFVKKCAPESRRRLCESLAPLQEVRADMGGAEKRVVSEEAKVERQREEVCGAIQQAFEQLKAVLERRKAELVGKVSSLAQEKKNALAAQKTVLQVAQKEIQLLTELVERNVESMSDQDLMSIRRQLQSKMEEEEKHHRQLSLEPTATADIACHLPSPDNIPRDLGSVVVQPTCRESGVW